VSGNPTGAANGLDAAAAAAAASAAGLATPKVSFHRRKTPHTAPTSAMDMLPRGSGAVGSLAADEHAIRGLGRLRASLLDSLRAERSKLERERAMLGRTSM
jgi:hypothetical protein